MKKVLVNEELLWQVLDALEAADKRDGVYSYRCEIDALRTLLDAPAVEPVVGALQIQLFSGEWVDCSQDTFNHYRKTGRKARALYTAPQPPAEVPLLTDDWLDALGLGRGDARLVEAEVRKQFGVIE